jgi:hypothetical protein
MLITLRLPRTSAIRLGLTITGIGEHEVVVTMTAVELAGRLSLAAGKAIAPQAGVDYSVAWRAASESLAGLVKKLGKTGLPRIVRKACKDRPLWAPRGNVAMLNWLQCVLEAYLLSGGRRGPATPRPGASAAEQQEDPGGMPARRRQRLRRRWQTSGRPTSRWRIACGPPPWIERRPSVPCRVKRHEVRK